MMEYIIIGLLVFVIILLLVVILNNKKDDNKDLIKELGDFNKNITKDIN